jgi:hypothetical protein
LSAKFTFQLESQDRRRALPHKIVIGQQNNETIRHVALKFLSWVLFFRERLQIETEIQNDAIPFVPDLIELGLDLRPLLWVECGECSVAKLHKLAVKCPEAEIWIVKRSLADARMLHATMEREEFRRGRYGIVGLDLGMFNEVCGLIRDRNEFLWVSGGLDPAEMKFDLNGLWFDTTHTVLRH